MDALTHARKRFAAAIAEVDRLKQSEFPYDHARGALDHLERMFKAQQVVLEKVFPQANASVVNNACGTSLYQLYVYVPILGFILRSTNVRNAFEAYAPLLRLARRVLDKTTKLIVSSEWDYSPFVYLSLTDLPGFVLIGLPAPESANPLLVPLAGHELGHSVWEAEGFFKQYQKAMEAGVLEELRKRWTEYHDLYPHSNVSDLTGDNLFVRSTWMPAYTWAQLQVEEIFCDFLGLRLFAESYLHAFAYLVSPRVPGQRSLRYPNILRRVRHLLMAAKEFGVGVESAFEANFQDEDEPSEPATKLLVSIADAVSEGFVPQLIHLVGKFSETKGLPQRSQQKVDEIAREFEKRVAPTPKAHALTDIVNAGWRCHRNDSLWRSVSQISTGDRDRILMDLLLKSMEVLEIQERLQKIT